MGRFKAGDRVKILAGHPYAGVGTEGVYVGRANRGYRGKHNVRVTYEDGNTSELAFKGRELELIDAPAAQEPAWVPKVGDRVRRVRHTGIISNCPIGHETTITRLLWHGRGFWYEGKDGSEQNSSRPDDWEVIPSLTIEAGKFYRTRDGRKVGPMVPTKVRWTDRSGLASAFDKEDGEQYSADGFWLAGGRHSKDDLVAEWVDEPIVLTGKGTLYIDDKPISEVTSLELPEATTGEVAVKVGDRVRRVAEGLDNVCPIGFETTITGVGDGIIWYTDRHGGKTSSAAGHSVWEVIATPEPAAPPAKFKVGDRVRAVKGTCLLNVGQDYTVLRYAGDEAVVAVDGTELSYPHDWFEPTPTESFIVARLTPQGQPRPNARPRVHTTLASAEQEAQRLADRLGDEFAVYQRVSTKTVDAGPVPNRPKENFERVLAGTLRPVHAFGWSRTKQGWWFWSEQNEALTPLGRAILRKWIAEAEAGQPKAAA